MRFILPLAALALTAIVITWPEMDNKILPVEKSALIPDTNRAQNELLNPRFESVDQNQNPYNVTAERAIQNQQNANLLKLEKPHGSMTMKDGAALNITSDLGSYEKEQEKLFLEKNVTLEHQSGYTLSTEELRVDLKDGQAFSDKDVEIKGDQGTIKAKGLDGDTETEILIFKGPATLTLNNTNAPANNMAGETPNE